ncbi:MAG: threonine-phosphate decarboxylase [Elusimicrobia bacterium RIFCSPLOWO2_12_FULL_59_9]|nr:MAG: threonine-phosphate decarboxylase [Elusimicrobia bacterium RIFCSPLOWO2_12_FULL_59_9]
MTPWECLDLCREHGGDVFAWSRRSGLDPREIIDFSANINPLGPPPGARKAFVESYGEIARYPDVEVHELRAALADRHGVTPAGVVLGNGSTQLIYLLCRALRPRKGLVVLPAFSEYANALKLAGARVRSHLLSVEDGFAFALAEFMKEWEEGADMVFLSNPNSATGQVIPRGSMRAMARFALRKKSLLVVDEAFMDFVESESIKDLVQGNPYLIVLRSLTKYYSIPGLRLGYLLTHRRTAEMLAPYQEPWSVNGPAQKVALACLAESTFSSRTTQWLQREKLFLLKGLAKVKGLHPYPSQVNFVLVGLDRIGINATELRSYLLQKSILIRSCDSFFGLGSRYFRVAVRLRKDNARLLKGLEEIMGPSLGE